MIQPFGNIHNYALGTVHNYDGGGILQAHGCHLQSSLTAFDKKSQWGSWQEVRHKSESHDIKLIDDALFA